MNESQFYILVKSTYYIHKKPFISYGVALVEPGEPVDIVIKTIGNLSCERKPVLVFIDLCNRLCPDLAQFDEMIEEFLS